MVDPWRQTDLLVTDLASDVMATGRMGLWLIMTGRPLALLDGAEPGTRDGAPSCLAGDFGGGGGCIGPHYLSGSALVTCNPAARGVSLSRDTGRLARDRALLEAALNAPRYAPDAPLRSW
jgi:hypothetical protein